jgi:hypothetical protein
MAEESGYSRLYIELKKRKAKQSWITFFYRAAKERKDRTGAIIRGGGRVKEVFCFLFSF